MKTTMALNISNRVTEALATVMRTLRDRFVKVRRRRAGRDVCAELDEIARHCASLPFLDNRSPNDILGYDENGLPT